MQTPATAPAVISATIRARLTRHTCLSTIHMPIVRAAISGKNDLFSAGQFGDRYHQQDHCQGEKVSFSFRRICKQPGFGGANVHSRVFRERLQR